jgi:DNA-binding FadR family transcriptional regulator
MILLIGSLEQIWSAHESSVWGDSSDPAEPAPMVDKTRRAALRDHQRLLDAIRDGNSARAVRLAQDHLAAARHKTLAFGTDKTIEAKLMSEIGSRLDSRFRHNGRPSAASGWGYPQPRSGEGAYAQSRKESGA